MTNPLAVVLNYEKNKEYSKNIKNVDLSKRKINRKKSLFQREKRTEKMTKKKSMITVDVLYVKENILHGGNENEKV